MKPKTTILIVKKINPMDPGQPFAGAVVVMDGRILGMGETIEPEQSIKNNE